MKLLLSPHNDDESLFAAFTLLRERPLVVFVTDGYVQAARSPSVTCETRRCESIAACATLGCATLFLGLRDDALTTRQVTDALRGFWNFDEVYAPADQGGHPQHDMVSRAAREVFFGRSVTLTEYCTYAADSRFYANEGKRPLVGTAAEWALKRKALACYPSQIWSVKHFQAVQDQPEWLTP